MGHRLHFIALSLVLHTPFIWMWGGNTGPKVTRPETPLSFRLTPAAGRVPSNKSDESSNQSHLNKDQSTPATGASAQLTAHENATASSPLHITHFKRPLYPLRAHQEQREGSVLIRLFVNHDGSLETFELLESSGSADLDQSALESLKEYRFNPGVHAHVRTAVVSVDFRLKDAHF